MGRRMEADSLQPMPSMTAGQLVTMACQLDVAAAKPGNVHRGADFEDVTVLDFLVSGVALGSAIDASEPADDVGGLIFDAVSRTGAVTPTNTNLGITLLVAPLAKLVQRKQSLTPASVEALIGSVEGAESQRVLDAVSLARPGGMGTSEQFDVANHVGKTTPLPSLKQIMRLAEGRDMIARLYGNGMKELFSFVLPAIEEGLAEFKSLTPAIVFAHVKTMAAFPDSLIARKLGSELAEKSAALAADCLQQLKDHDDFWRSVGDLDFWLRSDGHRRNPGTTADMITAALFIGLVTEVITPPFS